MSSNTLTDRAVEMFTKATPPLGSPIEKFRAGLDRMCLEFPLPDDFRVEKVNAGGIPSLRVSASEASNDYLVVHFHSGGYVMGSAYGYREFAYRLSAVTGVPVLVPDYRLAPEHPYPAPVEDALSVYRWLLDHRRPEEIILTGDSAGGGLALALMIAARDNGLPLPMGCVAISPLTDLAAEGSSYEQNKESDQLINRELAVEMGKVYIGERDPKQTPLASPLYADLSSLPPLMLFASDSEVLRDDTTRFADAVVKAGGEVNVVLQPDMPHIWTLFPFLPETDITMSEIGDFVKNIFHCRQHHEV